LHFDNHLFSPSGNKMKKCASPPLDELARFCAVFRNFLRKFGEVYTLRTAALARDLLCAGGGSVKW
jgi:hypothetical protein